MYKAYKVLQLLEYLEDTNIRNSLDCTNSNINTKDIDIISISIGILFNYNDNEYEIIEINSNYAIAESYIVISEFIYVICLMHMILVQIN